MHRPTPFGKYILLERVSVGGMAEVFKGKAFGVQGFARYIAIKRILPHLAEDPRFVEMFINEAKVAVQLNHANIAQVYELGRCDDDHYIAMEFVSGKDLLSLHQYARRTGDRVPYRLAAFIGSRVAEGLGYAHRKTGPDGRPMGIIHRDISPQNVLISYEGAVKLIDFGIAKAAVHSHQTQAGVLKGKFGYMSPEQISGKPLDQRSDIFALGTVVHEMLTGERLFFGENDFLTLEKVRAAKVDAPSAIVPEIPPALDEIVLRALAREPAERYQTAQQFAEDLSRFLHTTGAGISSKALRSWMRTRFAGDIAEEEAKDEQFARLTLTEEGDLLEEAEAEEDATALWDPLSEDIPDHIQYEPPPSNDGPRIISLVSRGFNGPGGPGGPGGSPAAVPQPAFEDPTGSITAPAQIANGVGEDDTIAGDMSLGSIQMPGEMPLVDPTVPQPLHPHPQPPRGQMPPGPLVGASVPGMPVSERGTDPQPLSGRSPTYTKTATAPLDLRKNRITRRDVLRAVLTLGAAGVGGVAAYQLLSGDSPAPVGELRVTVKPSDGLRITLDGSALEVDRSPLQLKQLSAGAHTIVIERDGYKPQTKTVNLEAGANSQVDVVLEPINTSPARLSLTVTPPGEGTQVKIAGADVELQAAQSGVDVPSGEPVVIEVIRTGFVTVSQTVNLKAGASRTLAIELRATPASLMIESIPPGRVFVDDQRYNRTPTTVEGLDPTRPHRVRIEAGGRRPYETTVEFAPGERFKRIDAELKR